MITSHDYNRYAVIVMAFMLFSSVALPWPRSSRPEASESAGYRPGFRMDSNPTYIPRTAPTAESKRAATARVDDAYGKLPIRFEENLGQTDSSVKFISRASGSTLFLTSSGAVLAVKSPSKGAVNDGKRSSSRGRVNALRMSMVGANAAPEIAGLGRFSGNSNYFRGNDPSSWRSNIPTYARVEYRELYPGVNLVYYGNEHQLEYDFQVAPGGNPGDIRMALEGVRKVQINADGDLVLRAGGSDIRMHKPSIYQETNGTRQSIAGRYVARGKRQIAFEVGGYDKSKALVIDPVLTYSTYLGGSSYEYGLSIATDSSGNAYVAGQTTSFNFPVTINAYSTTYINGSDVFVTKLSADGTSLIYSTYVGGNASDYGYGIAIDSSGNAYVTGLTNSNNYPTTAGAYQVGLQGGEYSGGDGFVTKLNADGTMLVYSTYLGGSDSDQPNGIAIDASGNAYIAGYTYSTNFPTTPGAFQAALSGGNSADAFVTKLNNTGTALVYSTYLGGTGNDQATAIKVDSSGDAHVTGWTTSTNFDVTPGAYQSTYAGGGGSYNQTGDVFATKFNPTGTSLIYSTYIGGASDDAGLGIELASSGEAYITGSSSSGNFPTTSGVVRVSNGGMAKSTNGAASWSASGAGLTNWTELSLAIDPSNTNVIFAGTQGAGVFKSTNGGAAWAATNSGLTDLTIRALTVDPTATSIIYLGTDSRGLFRSTNSGASWRAINTGQNGMMVNTIKIDPANSSIIYAGTNNGVFKTTNGGANWTAANAGFNQGLTVSAIAIDPSLTSTVYVAVGNYGSGVYKSTDAGGSWSVSGLNAPGVTSLALDPSAPSTIYAGGDGGVQKSTNGGITFNGINAGLANRSVRALAISPVDPSTIYAGTGNGIFKSMNGGAAWTPGNIGLAGAVVNALVIDPVTALTLYCGSASGSSDAFITKLNATGTALAYSTYLGGIGFDQGLAIAIDASGNAYVAGTTGSQNFPTVHGGFDGFGGYSYDAFVTKLNPAGAALVYSTYLGGTGYDYGYGLALDSSGAAYVTGYTQSQDFPVTDGAFQTAGYNTDAFMTKVAVAPSLTADVGITMTTSPNGPYVAGSSFNYDITVTNNGPEKASVMVSDELPDTVGFNGCYSSTNIYCSHFGNSVTFPINSLGVGASVNLHITAFVNCSIPGSAMIDNTVTVDTSAIDPNPSDNSAMATISATNPGTTLSPTSQLFDRDGGNGFINVQAGQYCTWTAVSHVAWATITSSTNCCYGYVNYTVAPNAGGPRSGTMTIAGQTFTVSQAGCNFTLDRDHQSFAGSGGSGTVNVTATIGSCAWTATTSSPFITITSGASGTGNGSVQYSVASNASPGSRSDGITIAGQTFTVYQGFDFLDVPPGNPFYDDIGKLAARGVTLGCGNGNYCPNAPITREQMAAFILRAKGEFSPPTPPSQRFSDVPQGNQFYNYIDRLAVLQITLGCTPDHLLYCPSDPVKRDQMAAFLLRGLGEFDPPAPGSQRFNDVPPASLFYNFIDRMAVLNITLGCTPDHLMYCPNDSVTRGQMAAFLVRAFNL